MNVGHILIVIDQDYPDFVSGPPAAERIACTREEGRTHQRFYVIERAVVDVCGYWPIVTINAKRCLIDASVPAHLDRIPRDAVEITGDLFEDITHNTDGDHSWIGRHSARVIEQMQAFRTARKASRS